MSFRFHIVSIVAVFLALAVGIGMGATVIDKATVDLLQRRLNDVRNQAHAADLRSDDLNNKIGRANNYEGRAEDYIVNDVLKGVPVTIIGMRGVDQGPLGDFKHTLDKSGATLQGTIWFPGKDKLDDARAATALQKALDATSSDASTLRQQLIARVSGVMAGASDASLLKPLTDGGFLEWEGAASGGDIGKVSFSQSRLIVASGVNPDVPNDQLAIPLVKSLAAAPTRRLAAIESGRDPDAKTSGERAVFLSPIRSDTSLAGRLSTVDDIEGTSGRVATVLALAQLPSGRTGNYGYGSSVDGPIPKLTP